MGLSIESYRKLTGPESRGSSDPRFVSALKHVLKKYPKTLKKLAE